MSNSFFTKAQSRQSYFKAGVYGKTGSGKTLTSMLWAEGLAQREGKRIAYVDTEYGVDFYVKDIPERIVHPQAFDIDRLVTRSITETIDAIESIDTSEYGVVVIDSITHLWEAAKEAYTGTRMRNGQIPIQAWGAIKKPYKKLMSLFLDGNFHAIICGREGLEMEEDDEGNNKVVGAKMKAEGETAYEPHILVRMRPRREDKDSAHTISVFFEKDRSGILAGKTVDWPSYGTIVPVVQYLSGSSQGKLGTAQDNAEKDAEALKAEAERSEKERETIFNQIRDALRNAKDISALQSAWGLTKGKKTKLGDDLMARLEAEKDARKTEMMGVAV